MAYTTLNKMVTVFINNLYYYLTLPEPLHPKMQIWPQETTISRSPLKIQDGGRIGFGDN